MFVSNFKLSKVVDFIQTSLNSAKQFLSCMTYSATGYVRLMYPRGISLTPSDGLLFYTEFVSFALFPKSSMVSLQFNLIFTLHEKLERLSKVAIHNVFGNGLCMLMYPKGISCNGVMAFFLVFIGSERRKYPMKIL